MNLSFTFSAYKIFGCRGSSTFLLKAIEQALDPNGDDDSSDRQVDVLILALGSPFGSPYEPESLAVQKAIKAGVVVVAAAACAILAPLAEVTVIVAPAQVLVVA